MLSHRGIREDELEVACEHKEEEDGEQDDLPSKSNIFFENWLV